MKIREITENLSYAFKDPKTGKRRGPSDNTLMSKPSIRQEKLQAHEVEKAAKAAK